MPRGRPLKALEVSQGAREELQSVVRSRSLPAGLVRRAEIVLLCADGLDNQAVAERVRTSRQTVGKWRERFRTQGLMGLYDERKPGRPRSIEDDELMVVLRRTLETRPPDGSTHWSCRSMAEATGVSKSTVHRLWRAFSIQPHRQKHFKLSTDPFFAEKVRDIVGLYEVHGPPALASVQHPASPAEALQALHRSVLRREGPRYRRTLPQPARQRDGALRRREEPDPRRWSEPSLCCPLGSDTSKASRMATSVTVPPTSLPPWTWPPARSSPSASRGIVTRSF